ncbi:MAG: hypothetical protein ACYTFV_09760 [Planctomycetota bacterium]
MAIDARETAEAIRLLREVRERLPEDVDVAIALQDAELAHLERGESLDELRAWLEVNPGRVDPDPLREYWTWYLARSRASGEPLDRLPGAGPFPAAARSGGGGASLDRSSSGARSWQRARAAHGSTGPR